MQGDLLCRSDPLPSRVDLGERLDGGDDCRSRHLDVADSLDDPLESGTSVLLTLREELKGMGVPVDACAVCEPELFRDRDRARPCNERLFNLEPFRMGADRASAAMASEADGFFFSQSLHRYPPSHDGYAIVPAICEALIVSSTGGLALSSE